MPYIITIIIHANTNKMIDSIQFLLAIVFAMKNE